MRLAWYKIKALLAKTKNGMIAKLRSVEILPEFTFVQCKLQSWRKQRVVSDCWINSNPLQTTSRNK